MAMDELGKKGKYPKSVFFIISNEFCERFAFYGIRTTLSLYLVDILLYSQNTATIIYHTFSMFAYFFPLLGAIIADSWLGKFRTIFYLSIVYALGQLLLSISSVPTLGLPMRELSILSLLLIAIGTGGIKPCVAAFGGDQFKLPQQEIYLTTFFTLFYFSINSGSLISTFLTPVLRKDVQCFDKTSCYPLAFLIPSILMILSVVIFFAGKSLYKMKQPEGNVFFNVAKCTSHAISRKFKSKGKREHWLDHADDQYSRHLIEDIKSVLKVLKLFIPLPIFWALFDQQGSSWTFQGTNMDGEVFGYVIKPDQFQVANPLFVIILIPIFQWAIYPVLEKFLFINTPLRRLTAGGFLAGLAFVISGILELAIEKTYIVKPSAGLAQVRIFNTLDCNATLIFNNEQATILEGLSMYERLDIEANGTTPIKLDVKYNNCKYTSTPIYEFPATLETQEKKAMSWALTKTGLTPAYEDSISRAGTSDPKVRALIYQDTGVSFETLNLVASSFSAKLNLSKELIFTDFVVVNKDSYKVSLDDKAVLNDMSVAYGGVYTIVGYASANEIRLNKVTVVEPNSVHILWQLPQYIIITMGEIMFSITGLEFAFTQAPASMKSLLQASWLLTVAFGNLIVVIIAEANFFERQVFEIFLFAGLMFVDVFIFAIMAKFYKYVEPASSDNSVSDEIDLESANRKTNESYSENL